MHELIDTTDNDCHDLGCREDLIALAILSNREDAEWNKVCNPWDRVKANRWIVRREGYSARMFKG